MKRPVAIVVISILVVLIGKCGIDRINSTAQQQHAKDGWYTLLGQLPSLPEFDTISVLYTESNVNYYGTQCYYASGYAILGSRLPKASALETYKKALVSSEWVVSDKPPVGDVFHRGENGELLIESETPPIIEGAINYQSLKSSYNSLLFVQLTYMLPHRDRC